MPTSFASDPHHCRYCDALLARDGATECASCYKRVVLGWYPPTPDDATQIMPALDSGASVLCATCDRVTNGYFIQPTPEGDRYYCLICTGTLNEVKNRARGRHDTLPPITDWPGEFECHAVLMASKHYTRMHGDGWHMNEVSDLLRTCGVKQDYEGRCSLGDDDDPFLRSVALQAMLNRWGELLRARSHGDESGQQSAA